MNKSHTCTGDWRRSEFTNRKLCSTKFTWCFHKAELIFYCKILYYSIEFYLALTSCWMCNNLSGYTFYIEIEKTICSLIITATKVKRKSLEFLRLCKFSRTFHALEFSVFCKFKDFPGFSRIVRTRVIIFCLASQTRLLRFLSRIIVTR